MEKPKGVMAMTDNAQKPTLKTCPLCGGEATITYCDEFCCGENPIDISCGVCQMYIPCHYTDDGLDRAIEQWNTRPEPTESQIEAGGELFKEFRGQFDRDPQQAAKLIYKAMQEAVE
jgi:hypothetical protein